MRVTVGLFVCIVWASVMVAQDAGEENKDATSDWMKFYAQRAEQYEMGLEGDDRKLELFPTTLLQYTNPERGRQQHGAVFLWTLEGVPQAIGTIWSITDLKDAAVRRVTHEFHSLSQRDLWAQRPPAVEERMNVNRQVGAWNPKGPGIEFQQVQPEGKIAQTAVARLIQMRHLAGQFEASAIARQDQSNVPLRFLRSPLTRYSAAEQGIVDGCIFAYVVGTDPELFLVIECRRDEDGQLAWYFAPARFTGLALRLRHQNKEVWRCDPLVVRTANDPYSLTFGVTVLPADFPVEKKQLPETSPDVPQTSTP